MSSHVRGDARKRLEVAIDSLEGSRDVEAELDALRATVERVEALHRPDGGTPGEGAICVHCTSDFGSAAEEPVPWPCPTVAALAPAEATDGEGEG